MAKTSALARANARAKKYLAENETLQKGKRAALAIAKSEAGQAVAIGVAAGGAGAVVGYKAEEWLHDPERQFDADSILIKGVGGIPVTALAGAGIAAVGIVRIFQKKGKLKVNSAIAGLGAGMAGGGYIYKVSTEAP